MSHSPAVTTAILPVAGLGTRFLPATKAIPKEMLPIVDVPAVQLVVEEALDSGIEQVIVVTGHGKHAIEDHFDISYELEDTLARRGQQALLERVAAISRRVHIVSVRQKQPLGLGHAVRVARQAAGDRPVAVLLGDDLIDHLRGDGTADQPARPAIGQLIDQFQQLGGEAAVIALLEVEAGEEQNYGVVSGRAVEGGAAADAGRLLRLDDLVEKPAPGTAPSRLAIIGRYVLPASMWPILERTPPGRGGEIQLTDALRLLVTEGAGCYGWRFRGLRHDTGDRLGYLGANLSYALERPDLRAGLLDLMRKLLASETSD
jgi:UTP--glucose-1-phosphate uridylyltransferase